MPVFGVSLLTQDNLRWWCHVMPIQRGDSRYSNYPKNTQLEQEWARREDAQRLCLNDLFGRAAESPRSRPDEYCCTSISILNFKPLFQLVQDLIGVSSPRLYCDLIHQQNMMVVTLGVQPCSWICEPCPTLPCIDHVDLTILAVLWWRPNCQIIWHRCCDTSQRLRQWPPPVLPKPVRMVRQHGRKPPG